LRFSIDTIRCGVYIFNLGYMPLIAKVMCSAPPHSIFPALRKERRDLAYIALRLETNGPIFLGF
jgi:hypothetical protein